MLSFPPFPLRLALLPRRPAADLKSHGGLRCFYWLAIEDLDNSRKLYGLTDSTPILCAARCDLEAHT